MEMILVYGFPSMLLVSGALMLWRNHVVMRRAHRQDRVADRIDCDDLGVDDVVVNDVKMFRLERMDDNSFWLCCYKNNGDRDIVFRVNSDSMIKIGVEYE